MNKWLPYLVRFLTTGTLFFFVYLQAGVATVLAFFFIYCSFELLGHILRVMQERIRYLETVVYELSKGKLPNLDTRR